MTGGSADFTHAELGHGIPCSREEALALARQFRQVAIFEVRDGTVFLHSTRSSGLEQEVIGKWSELVDVC